MFLIVHFYAVMAIATAFQFLSFNLRMSDTPTLVAHRFVFGTMLASFVGRLVGVVSWFAFSHNPFNPFNSCSKRREQPKFDCSLVTQGDQLRIVFHVVRGISTLHIVFTNSRVNRPDVVLSLTLSRRA